MTTRAKMKTTTTTTASTKLTAFMYVRVSTPSQQVDEQVRMIRQYAADHGIEIIRQYGEGISVLIDVNEKVGNEVFSAPVYTYQDFRREKGLTVEQSLQEAGYDDSAATGIQIPTPLIIDCVRLCCSLCLLENDPSVIEPDVLSKDRVRFEASGDQKFVDKAHRRGKVGWNVGRQIEVAPHYRRPHMALVWTGSGRAVPKVVPRRGSVVHREKVEKVPSGFGGE